VNQADSNLRIDYIEFPARDIAGIKSFYSQVFGWKFEDYGPGYTAFQDGRLSGGFTTEAKPGGGGPLVVIYTADLESAGRKIQAAGGAIVKEAFSFPGGRRFHFADPSGNVLAVWSDAPQSGSS
jgi:predicted enzyme related to lactoylglutathione lyase